MRFPSFALGVVLLCSFTCIASARESDATSLQQGDAPAKDSKSKKKPLSNAQIKQLLIDESIAAYSGNCPCPYNTASNGSRCGRRSAKDVSAEMVKQYREQHPEE